MKPRHFLVASLCLFLTFCLQTGLFHYYETVSHDPLLRTVFAVGAQAVVYLPALFLLRQTQPKIAKFTAGDCKLCHRRACAMALSLGVAMGCATWLIRYGVAQLLGEETFTLQPSPFAILDGETAFVWLVCGGVLSAIVEELVLRGYLQKRWEGAFGSRAVIACSGVFFALMSGGWEAFFGYLMAGMAFAWLVVVTGTVLSSMLAHFGFVFALLTIGELLDSFAIYGLWQHMAKLVGLVALSCWYFFMRSAHKRLLAEQLRPMETVVDTHHAFLNVATNAGTIALLFAFIAKAIFGAI